MTRSSEVSAFSALVAAAVIWGGSVVGQKWALTSFSAVEASVLRGLGALAILVPWWWWKERAATTWTGRDLAVLGVLGLGVLGNHLLTFFGLRYIGAGVAGVIIGASPVITALLSSLMIRDVPFRAVAAGCGVSFAGVVLVSGIGTGGAAGTDPLIGGLLVLAGVVSWSLYSIGGRRIMERLSPLTVNWTTLAVSIVLQVPLLGTDRKMQTAGIGSVEPSAWLALAYLVLFATAIAQQAWLFGVQGIGPARAGVFLNLIPVSALALSGMVLGEAIGGREVAGIAMILTGVWLVNRRSSGRRST